MWPWLPYTYAWAHYRHTTDLANLMCFGKLLYSEGGVEGLITTKLTGTEVHLHLECDFISNIQHSDWIYACALERMDMLLIVNRCVGWLKGNVNKKGTLGLEYQYYFFLICFILIPLLAVNQMATSAAKQQAPQPPMVVQLSNKMYSSNASNC